MDGWDDDRDRNDGPCCDQMRLYRERQIFLKRNPTIAGSVSDRLRFLADQPGIQHPNGIRILANDTRALEERIATLEQQLANAQPGAPATEDEISKLIQPWVYEPTYEQDCDSAARSILDSFVITRKPSHIP